MQFFLQEVVARIVAIYLCVDCGRDLWRGFVERKIAYYSTDWLDWSNWVADRDATPIRYWMQMGLEAISMVACFFVAIFGWWVPNA
jgi:hypothetical protein